jgi:predicted Zn-dependent protease
MSAMNELEARFETARKVLFGELTSGEELSIDFMGERSAFMRFNGGKVRQFGEVDVAYAVFRLFREGRSIEAAFNLTGDTEADTAMAARSLSRAREECSLLPPDPYRSPSKSTGTSSESFPGSFPASERLPSEVLKPAAGLDFVGYHTQGTITRGAANSAGARHWFATETFNTDWSAWLPSGKAVKSCYAGRQWDGAEHARRLASAKARLEPLSKPERRLEPGEYRAYISPDAVNEMMPFFSWNGLSERGLREGESAYLPLREGRRSLSPAFTLVQDFGLGVEPRFNESGDVAPEKLVLIDKGRLAATLVSERSAAQYGVPSNAAPDWEGLRSPAVAAGSLPEKESLAALGTGVYVSNFHYLNWSDIETARITGMTRFACFWVEGGQLVAPIKDMRFDESLYDLLGGKLEALTAERSLVPESMTYGMRALGGALLPGLLVNGLKFTL